jgi:hypothetical protein
MRARLAGVNPRYLVVCLSADHYILWSLRDDARMGNLLPLGRKYQVGAGSCARNYVAGSLLTYDVCNLARFPLDA